MDVSTLVMGVSKGLQVYTRLPLCFILGCLFLLAYGTGPNQTILLLLRATTLGYGAKLFGLAIIALVIGLTLHGLARLCFMAVDSILMRFAWYKKTILLSDFFTDFISSAAIRLEKDATAYIVSAESTPNTEADSALVRSLVFYYNSTFPDLDQIHARQWFYVDLSMGIVTTAFVSMLFAAPSLRIALMVIGIAHMGFAWVESRRQIELEGAIITVGYLREKSRAKTSP